MSGNEVRHVRPFRICGLVIRIITEPHYSQNRLFKFSSCPKCHIIIVIVYAAHSGCDLLHLTILVVAQLDHIGKDQTAKDIHRSILNRAGDIID